MQNALFLPDFLWFYRNGDEDHEEQLLFFLKIQRVSHNPKIVQLSGAISKFSTKFSPKLVFVL